MWKICALKFSRRHDSAKFSQASSFSSGSSFHGSDTRPLMDRVGLRYAGSLEPSDGGVQPEKVVLTLAGVQQLYFVYIMNKKLSLLNVTPCRMMNVYLHFIEA
jgi:hypothetical protein